MGKSCVAELPPLLEEGAVTPRESGMCPSRLSHLAINHGMHLQRFTVDGSPFST
jgi:hypothetical protein